MDRESAHDRALLASTPMTSRFLPQTVNERIVGLVNIMEAVCKANSEKEQDLERELVDARRRGEALDALEEETRQYRDQVKRTDDKLRDMHKKLDEANQRATAFNTERVTMTAEIHRLEREIRALTDACDVCLSSDSLFGVVLFVFVLTPRMEDLTYSRRSETRALFEVFKLTKRRRRPRYVTWK